MTEIEVIADHDVTPADVVRVGEALAIDCTAARYAAITKPEPGVIAYVAFDRGGNELAAGTLSECPIS